ncbi:MAG: type II toxin-antitoxin system VapB family antitoxin [Actinomycetes bacterium]
MSLNIKNPETERLARELAAVTQESVTAAVTVAVRERLERLQGGDEGRRQQIVDTVMKIAADAGPRWREPYRSTSHGDLLYDDQGLPR